jgi:hypothetical protein
MGDSLVSTGLVIGVVGTTLFLEQQRGHHHHTDARARREAPP